MDELGKFEYFIIWIYDDVNDNVLVVSMLLCGKDVASIVISYLSPCCLVNFFVDCGLDFDMKFVYDGKGYVLGWREVNFIFGAFCNIALVGLTFKNSKERPFFVNSMSKLAYCGMQCGMQNLMFVRYLSNIGPGGLRANEHIKS